MVTVLHKKLFIEGIFLISPMTLQLIPENNPGKVTVHLELQF